EKQIITETYVSYNGFSDIEQNDSNGLQIVLMQHPNKLRAGEKLSFKITYSGKPIPEAEVALKTLNKFYYQDSDKVEIELEPKDKGLVTFEPTLPGRYLLGVEYEVELKDNKMADFRSIEKFLTFEITQ
ncbi:MAG TPA: hypothetical protein DEO86_01790, partial [Colwellia sp.]|nr:hypothetical protein [Colwellia sp.]